MRILLAEDNADIARIVSFYLKNMRIAEVVVCRDGGEAIAAMTQSPINLAVLDGSMPVADGPGEGRFIVDGDGAHARPAKPTPPARTTIPVTAG